MSGPTAAPRTSFPKVGFAAALAAFALAAAALALSGQLPEIARIGVPTMQPEWIDARSISGASISLAQGRDPLVDNPGDVLDRPMNYPRPWLLLGHLGLRPEHTAWLALAFFALFGAGLVSLLPLAGSRRSAVLMAAGVFSPVVWLGIERANNDLAMFGLVAIAALLAATRPRLSAAAVLLAGVLKLFPIFALAGLSAERRARRAAVVAGAVFLGYAAWSSADIRQIRAGTYHWNRIGYGIDQLANTLARAGWPAWPLLAGAIAVALTALLVGLRARARARLGAIGSAHQRAAFAMGAGIYVGTFCTGSNFDYRLVCLLLVVPQLAAWTTSGAHRLQRGAAAATAAIMLLLWSMTWRHWLQPVPGGEALGLLLDEVLSYGVLWALLIGLVLALPDALVPAAWRDRAFLDGEPHPVAAGGAALPQVGERR